MFRKKFFFALLVGLCLVFAQTKISLAEDGIIYPKVSSVSPTTLGAGEILALSGTGFQQPGKLNCNKSYDPITKQFDSFIMNYTTVIGAYKIPTTAPTSGRPDFRLEIISFSESLITARIPASAPSGDYYIGINAEGPKNVCPGFGEILVGFGKYDKITVKGTTVSTSTPKPTIKATPFPTPKSTTVTGDKPFTSPEAKPTEIPIVSQSPESEIPVVNFFSNIFKNISSFFSRLFVR